MLASPVLRRVLASVILLGAVLARKTFQSQHATMSTFEWMGIYSNPFEPSLFVHDLFQGLSYFTLGCLGSAWLVLLAAWLWQGQRSSQLLTLFKKPWFCPLLAFIAAVLVRTYALHNIEAVTDESGMIFQAEVFSSGHWTAPAPPSYDHFAHPAYKVLNNRWSYIGAPGWPMLLALGRLLSIPNLVSPLVLAGVVWLMQRLSRSWHGPEAAAWTGVLALGTPNIVLNGACSFSHLATAFWGLATFNCLEQVHSNSRSLVCCLLGGICLGMTASTRAVDGVVLCAVLFLWRVVLPPAPYRRPSLLQVVVLAAGLGLGLLPLLEQNLAISGNPFKTGYQVHGVATAFLATSLPGRIHLAFLSLMRLLFWASPFLFELTVFACRRTDRRIWFLLLMLVGTDLIYAHPEMLGIGGRYLLPSLVLITTFAGSSCATLMAGRGRKFQVLLPLYFLFVGGAIYPDYIRPCYQTYSAVFERDKWINLVIGPNGIGILRFDPYHMGMSFTTNRPDLQGPLRVVSLGPEQDADLVRSFPGRQVIYLDFNLDSTRLEVKPFDRSQDDFTRLCGAAHYDNEAEKPEEALKVWSQIPDDSPWKAAALANSVKLLTHLGRLEEARALQARLR